MSSVLDKANQLLTPKKNQEFFYNFLAQTENEYYDDSPGVDKTKKIKPSNADQYPMSGTINTSLIDGFRQGVEITQMKHFFAGTSPRIHAGEPGHILRKNLFGSDRNYLKQDYYKDIDYYNPISYLTSDQEVTYPVVTHDTDETENFNLNGTIEPLTIRAVAALYSIDVPFEAHSVKGIVMDGNHEMNNSTSRIVNIFEKNPQHRLPAWLDLVDMVGTVKKVPTIAYFNDEKTYINPFNDTTKKIQSSNNLPNDMIDPVAKLEGSTENYISEQEISATSGWTYDDVWSKGTDSIAFGGLGY